MIFLNLNKYVGIDDSNTPFSDIKVDLLKYTSNVDGIFIRHVLERINEYISQHLKKIHIKYIL